MACANGQGMHVVLHLVRRVGPSGIVDEYPWCHGLQRAENIQRNDDQRPAANVKQFSERRTMGIALRSAPVSIRR